MELTQYQAVFAILLIFFVGDLVGALTKAKISSMFVIMMGFMVLFLTGIYPADIMTTSGFAAVASLGQYFLLFNMGTSVDIPTLRREWRTVVGAVIGMAAAIARLLRGHSHHRQGLCPGLRSRCQRRHCGYHHHGGGLHGKGSVRCRCPGHLHLCRAEVRGARCPRPTAA